MLESRKGKESSSSSSKLTKDRMIGKTKLM